MNTLLKLLRSFITSFLFILLIIILIIQNIFLSVRINNIEIKEELKKSIVKISDVSLDISDINLEEKREVDDYLDKYVLYFTTKRSFPNMLTDSDKVKVIIEKINKSINVTFNQVLKIRDVLSIISNNAIFLLVFIFSIVIVLLISITNNTLSKVLEYYSLASILSVLCIYSISFIFQLNLLNINEINIKLLLNMFIYEGNLINGKSYIIYSTISLIILIISASIRSQKNKYCNF